jgi:DNA-binding MarR family transcriptional regulator
MRVITERQEQAYRLVAGEFEGLTVAEAAEKMRITPQAVNQLLRSMEKQAPQLFPLVTKIEYSILMLLKIGNTNREIAEALNMSGQAVSRATKRLIQKGRWGRSSRPETLQSYDSSMDAHIRERF